MLARLADEMRAQSALVAVMGELGEQLARMEARHSEYSHGEYSHSKYSHSDHS